MSGVTDQILEAAARGICTVRCPGAHPCDMVSTHCKPEKCSRWHLYMDDACAALAAVAPMIAAAERERCAKWHDEQADGERSLAQAARSAGDREAGGHHAHLAAEHRQSAAAIRAMGDADE